MKNRLLATLVASVTMLAMAFVANAGQPENDELVFYNATEFEIGGKATKETLTPFDRLPASYEKTTRPELWRHGHHSAGSMSVSVQIPRLSRPDGPRFTERR